MPTRTTQTPAGSPAGSTSAAVPAASDIVATMPRSAPVSVPPVRVGLRNKARGPAFAGRATVRTGE